MKKVFPFLLLLTSCQKQVDLPVSVQTGSALQVTPTLFPANDPRIFYEGRTDRSSSLQVKVYTPGSYEYVIFTGTYCSIKVGDGSYSHNWITYSVDGKQTRIKLTSAINVIQVATGLAYGDHVLIVMKDSEASIGFITFNGIFADGIKKGYVPDRRTLFIGDSQTEGSASNLSPYQCGTGAWYDQEDAYNSFGAVTARALNANFQLAAISGVGLTKSYGGAPVIEQLYDHRDLSPTSALYDFAYHPQLIVMCLGQNDLDPNHQTDSAAFVNKYLAFIQQVRRHDPTAQILLINSPMSSPAIPLSAYIEKVKSICNARGDGKVSFYKLPVRYSGGCGNHPDVTAHQQIASLIVQQAKYLMRW